MKSKQYNNLTATCTVISFSLLCMLYSCQTKQEDPTPSNNPPSVSVGDDQFGKVDDTFNLKAEATDQDGDQLIYQWEIVNGPNHSDGAFDFSTEASTNFTTTEPGLYTVSVTTKDPTGASAKDSLKIYVSGVLPPTIDEDTELANLFDSVYDDHYALGEYPDYFITHDQGLTINAGLTLDSGVTVAVGRICESGFLVIMLI